MQSVKSEWMMHDVSTIHIQQIPYLFLGALCVMASTAHGWRLYTASIREGHEGRLLPEDKDSKGIQNFGIITTIYAVTSLKIWISISDTSIMKT
jgi:hypothetical protein